jgi:filamentous hemagglutinin family protein
MATRTLSSRARFEPRLLPVALAAALALGGPVFAAPAVTQLPVVKPGGAQINATVGTATGGANPTLGVTQNASGTNRALVEWESFSIGSSAKVIFTQPNAQSILINRVTGNANGIPASEIYGGISANGRVFLVNPTGIVFGPTTQVNVGSLVATTLDLSASMTANNYAGFINGSGIDFETTVAPAGGRSVQVLAPDDPLVPQIQAGEGGSILLIGRDGVEQSGTISAPRGSITLSTSGSATLAPVTTSGYIEVALDTPAVRSGGVLLGLNSQTLASGGAIRIGAIAEESGTRSETITIQGVVSTDSTTGAGGTIDIDAGSDAASKLVLTGAALGANSSVGKGGRITLDGRDIALNDTGPVSVTADGATGGGGIVVGGTGTGSLVVAGNAVVSADATGNGDGGSITMQAMLNRMVSASPIGLPRTEFGVLEMYGTLHARGGIDGGSGGSIETSGLAMTTSLTDSTTGLIGAGTVDARARAASGKAGTWTLDPFDVTISTTGPTTTDGAFNPTGPGANIRAADISAALDSGTSVTISTGQAGSGSATGNVTVEAGTAIVRSAGTGNGSVSLTLQAHDSIAIGIGSSITAKGAGPMDINLLSDLDGNGSGNISISGATLATGGGSLLLSGGATPTTGFAHGNGQIAGVDLNTSSIDTRGSSAAGNVTIRGAGGPGTFESGVVILGTDITANNIGVLGTAGAGLGVQISDSTLTSAAGTVELRGIATRISTAGDRAIGLDIGSLSISAGTGSVLLAGRADDAGFALTGSSPAVGLRYSSLSFAGDENSTATITLAGQAANATGGAGVQYHVGESNVMPASTGANVVIGGESGGGTALDLGTLFNPFVLTTGSVNFRPLGVDANGGLTEQSDIAIRIGVGNGGGVPGNEFRVDASWLQPAGENNGGMTAGKGIVVGSAGHVGRITLDDGVLTNHDSVSLTLQNQGNGAAGIVLGGENAVGTLGLMSSGIVTQTGAIAVQTLVIQGSGGNNVTLTNAQNQIGTLAFDPPGSLSVVTAGNLVVDAASAASFDAAGAGFSMLAITDSQGGATALLQAAGSITLNRSISMDNEIGRLDIVSPTQVIFGTGATLSAGTRWSVWAPSVTGLAADSGAIRYYGCAFGDTGTCSVSGIALPQTGQQVLLPTQPTVNVAATPANGPTGAIPPLTYTVTGLQDGDTAATALSGALATTATPTSPGGSYAITQGTLTSPTGYVITFQGANLVLGVAQFDNLDILGITREALQSRFQSQFESGVYGRNLAQPYICTAASLTRGLSADDKQSDPLAAEWGKVRNQPQLSGCLDVSDGGSCSAF